MTARMARMIIVLIGYIFLGLVLLYNSEGLGAIFLVIGVAGLINITYNIDNPTKIKGASDIVQYEYNRGESSISGKYEILETETGNASGYIIMKDKEADKVYVIEESKLKNIGRD